MTRRCTGKAFAMLGLGREIFWGLRDVTVLLASCFVISRLRILRVA